MRAPVLKAAMLIGMASGLGGCLEVGLTGSTAFPPEIPGLDRAQPWVRLPVGIWVTESDIAPVAMAGCFEPACTPAAAVGLFQARGVEAERLARMAQAPGGLARLLLADGKARSHSSRKASVSITDESIREGPWRGSLLHLARQDGSKAAHGAVLTRMTGGTLSVLIVVSPKADAALRIARDVARTED